MFFLIPNVVFARLAAHEEVVGCGPCPFLGVQSPGQLRKPGRNLADAKVLTSGPVHTVFPLWILSFSICSTIFASLALIQPSGLSLNVICWELSLIPSPPDWAQCQLCVSRASVFPYPSRQILHWTVIICLCPPRLCAPWRQCPIWSLL